MFKRVIASILLFILCAFVVPFQAQAAPTTTGAVNNWFTVSEATRLSVDFTIRGSQDGYHYYSLSPFFSGKDYGLYSGIQTTQNGPLFIFSVWNATSSYPENGSYSVAFTGEGEGHSLRHAYDWKLDKTYTVTIQREAFDSANNGWRWSSTITDKSTSQSLKLGEIPAPAGAETMTSGAVFHERYSGTEPVCDTSTNLEKTSMMASNLASDKPVSFDGDPVKGGIFATQECEPYMHAAKLSSTSVVTAFGMTAAEYKNLDSPDAAEPEPEVAGTSTESTSPPTESTANDEALPNTGPGTGLIIALAVLTGLISGVIYYLMYASQIKRKVRWFANQVGLINR